MAYEVRFRPSAEDDLTALYDYIADVASPRIAGNYLDRIEKTCLSLATFPTRGTARDDLAPDIRTIGFERRVTIAFGLSGVSSRLSPLPMADEISRRTSISTIETRTHRRPGP